MKWRSFLISCWSRGALLFLIEKDSTRDNGGEGPLPDLAEEEKSFLVSHQQIEELSRHIRT